MAKTTLRELKAKTDTTGLDIIKVLERDPRVTVEQGANHAKARNERGTVAIPRHAKPLPTGTHHAIFKQLALIGVTVLVLGLFIATIIH